MKLLNVDGQTERLTNKMKLRLAYHDFAEHLKNSFKMQGRIENIPFSRTAVVSDQNTNTKILWHTHLICILISTNSISMVNIRHSDFIPAFSGIIYCYVTTISSLTPPICNKPQKTPCADEYNVYKINPVIYLMCEEPATVNV